MVLFRKQKKEILRDVANVLADAVYAKKSDEISRVEKAAAEAREAEAASRDRLINAINASREARSLIHDLDEGWDGDR